MNIEDDRYLDKHGVIGVNSQATNGGVLPTFNISGKTIEVTASRSKVEIKVDDAVFRTYDLPDDRINEPFRLGLSCYGFTEVKLLNSTSPPSISSPSPQMWDCCWNTNRSGPGCKAGPHPNPYAS